jgi:hypothetical protein
VLLSLGQDPASEKDRLVLEHEEVLTRGQMVSFYRKWDTSKIKDTNTIDQILTAYKASGLLQALYSKYAAHPTPLRLSEVADGVLTSKLSPAAAAALVRRQQVQYRQQQAQVQAEVEVKVQAQAKVQAVAAPPPAPAAAGSNPALRAVPAAAPATGEPEAAEAAPKRKPLVIRKPLKLASSATSSGAGGSGGGSGGGGGARIPLSRAGSSGDFSDDEDFGFDMPDEPPEDGADSPPAAKTPLSGKLMRGFNTMLGGKDPAAASGSAQSSPRSQRDEGRVGLAMDEGLEDWEQIAVLQEEVNAERGTAEKGTAERGNAHIEQCSCAKS